MANNPIPIRANSPAALVIAVIGMALIVFRDVFNHVASGAKKGDGK